jgi:hypothetical protein
MEIMNKKQDFIGFYGTFVFAFTVSLFLFFTNYWNGIIEVIFDFLFIWIGSSVVVISYFSYKNKHTKADGVKNERKPST